MTQEYLTEGGNMVRVKDFTCWSTSISFLFGKTPKVTMICGKCSHQFSKRFAPSDFRNGYPKAMCSNCLEINEVPLRVE